MNPILSFLLLVTIIGCHAQTSVNVYVQDTVQCPSGYLSTNFIGVKMDANTGIATVNFIGGDEADHSYVLSFETEDQSGAIGWYTTIPITFSTAATYWVYLAGYGTTYNYDWIEIRVVASTFSGTITALYGTAPSGWYEGWPPYYATMVSGKVPPPSQPAPARVSISKILVPILVVVIVLAITIPAGVYIYRRRQAKKMMMMDAQVSTPENQVPVQMNSVVV